MEILHIAKTPPAAPEITHIDVRLTRGEAFMIGAYAARTNGPLADALLPFGASQDKRTSGQIATDLYTKMRVALNLPVDGFNDHYTYLALVDGPGYVGQDGRAIPDYDVQGKQAETIAAQTRELECLRAELATARTTKNVVANGIIYTPAEAAARIESLEQGRARLQEQVNLQAASARGETANVLSADARLGRVLNDVRGLADNLADIRRKLLGPAT